MREAMFWEPAAGNNVRCALCHHRCLIGDGERGICRVRENRAGKLYTLVYGRLTATAADPIEKKPLYHFLPGTLSFSIATKGCNFRCIHCQNCDISQPSPDDDFADETLVEPAQAVRMAGSRECRSISYTYTEPTIFFEYAYDTARLARDAGLKNVFVTNGYMTPEALRAIRPYLDAANIDLKTFRDDTHRRLCGAKLRHVLDTIKLFHELGIWIEVTTLVIPGWNDSRGELQEIAEFLAGVGTEIPWHVTRFFPAYKLADAPPTPLDTLETARKIGKEAGLQYVYIGNAAREKDAETTCPSCGSVVIRRAGAGSGTDTPGVPSCATCGRRIEGVWE